MTEKANPSINRPAEAFKTAGAIAYGGHGGSGFVVDGANPTEISVQDSAITEANLNEFQETSTGTSLDVTIDGGEAFVFGSWIAIDSSTTVSLAASTSGQTVYVGWNKNGADDVIVGLASAFSSATGDVDKKIPLWDFDTDASGVTSTTDRRAIGYSVSVEGEAKFGPNADVIVSYDSVNDDLDIDGADLSVSGVTVVDQSQGYIPQSSLENDNVTISSGTSLTGGGSISLGGSLTINHADTSTQGNVSAGAGAAVTDIDLNSEGHVTNIGTTDFDSRFVALSGDTMTGLLTLSDGSTAASRNWVNTSADVPNADFADNAGNANTVDGYDIQKNGTDGTGIINFKTN